MLFLTLKAPFTTVVDDILVFTFLFLVSKKVKLDISYESSAYQTIHIKMSNLIFSGKSLECRLYNFEWCFNKGLHMYETEFLISIISLTWCKDLIIV